MRKKSFPKYTPLIITWEDIISEASWQSEEDINKARLYTIKTLGFFLQNDKKSIKVGHSLSEDNQSDYTMIPWSVIKNIKVLEYGS